jgi:stage V sporulation protein SpoVS
MNREIPAYTEREGTVKISGITQPRKAGRCAYFYLRKGLPVEFFAIGANANQQAMKSMGVFIELVESDDSYKGRTVAFQPRRFRTHTVDNETAIEKDKDATVWQTFLVEKI